MIRHLRYRGGGDTPPKAAGGIVAITSDVASTYPVKSWQSCRYAHRLQRRMTKMPPCWRCRRCLQHCPGHCGRAAKVHFQGALLSLTHHKHFQIIITRQRISPGQSSRSLIEVAVLSAPAKKCYDHVSTIAPVMVRSGYLRRDSRENGRGTLVTLTTDLFT